MRKGVVVLVMVAVGFIAGQAEAQNLTCTGTVFNDVNATTQPSFCGWIEWFSDLGITAGCSLSPPLFCPNNFVTRAQMAVFVSKAMRGGHDNSVTFDTGTVGGGISNIASGEYSTVCGGADNTASGRLSVVAGGSDNDATGGGSFVGGGDDNTASGASSVVSGGVMNTASARMSVMGGGERNTASGEHSTVCGGSDNTASGEHSTVAGGLSNTASGRYSFVAGRRARANADGCFVWGDSTDDAITCGLTPNRWVARASGGVDFYSNSGGTTGVRLFPREGAWVSVSDRDLKDNFVEIDQKEILERLSAIPIRTWNWKAQGSSIRHLGPVSQDFYAAFKVGVDDRHISTVDADGVALAAIQGLYQVVKEKDAAIAEQDARIRQLEAALAEVLKRVAALEKPTNTIAQK